MAAPFTIAAAQVYDSQQTAMVKLAYWLELAAKAQGSTGTTTMFQPSMSASHNDTLQVATVKAAYWAEQLYDNIGGGAGGITAAAGDPPIDGSITTLFYKNTTTGAIYVNSGSVAVPTWDSI